MPTDLARRTRRALLDYYDGSRRALPWRRPPLRGGARSEPYRVWISEVMLQQTRVDAVIPYYQAWMRRFPDVVALAGAPLDDVLRAWEGLGYYARARNLHRAALVVRDRMGGELPSTATDLRELPGVGEYTAGAVASIAFGERVPAVDGNARRVLARLFDEPSPTPAWLRERARRLVDPRRPGDFNQALMELGATVCVPRSPACGACPIRSDCLARQRGTVAERPLPKRRAPLPEREFGVAVLVRSRRSGRELLLARRPDQGLLGGLWELPSALIGGGRAPGKTPALEAAEQAARSAGLRPTGEPVELPPVRHVFSHFRGTYRPFLWELPRRFLAPGAGYAWVDRSGLDSRALPSAQRRITDSVAESHLKDPPPQLSHP